uniref:Si:ch211-141o9.10 n=1 Tax=Cynoglossus semilaevis TaxID=244447 RepID=A0A3P8WZM7_CYNSE
MGPKIRGSTRRKREEDDDYVKTGGKRRTRGKGKYIGAHVRIAGGIWKAVEECVEMGGRSFGMFLGPKRSWKRSPLDPESAARFQAELFLRGIDPAHVVPHGSYLMNCGSSKADVYRKSEAMLVDDLHRCSLLGLSLYNFHPGSTTGSITTEECTKNIAKAINFAHRQVPGVITGIQMIHVTKNSLCDSYAPISSAQTKSVLENMCCQGGTVGGKFSELRNIIDRVRDQSRVGVCIDTCHAFAAGYDLAAKGGFKRMLNEFDCEVGLQYLEAIHLNDSRGQLGCKLDRHEDIGRGYIGISAFREIVNEPKLNNIPMILETPTRRGFTFADQIDLLYSMYGRRNTHMQCGSLKIEQSQGRETGSGGAWSKNFSALRSHPQEMPVRLLESGLKAKGEKTVLQPPNFLCMKPRSSSVVKPHSWSEQLRWDPGCPCRDLKWRLSSHKHTPLTLRRLLINT